MRSLQAGRAMIGVIVAAVIGLALVIFFVVGPPKSQEEAQKTARPDHMAETVVGKARYAAKDDVCRQQLRQVRESLQIAADPVENTFPATLAETKLGSDLTSCPVGKEPYAYDSSSGTVKCIHPGHGGY